MAHPHHFELIPNYNTVLYPYYYSVVKVFTMAFSDDAAVAAIAAIAAIVPNRQGYAASWSTCTSPS